MLLRLVVIMVLMCCARANATFTIYATDFEPDEPGGGYSGNFDLAGQNGWQGNASSNWNGVADGFINGLGRQAYIGYYVPENSPSYLSVWQPLNFHPLSSNAPLVIFSVIMGVWEFSPDEEIYDDFFWSVYNTEGHRLFTLDFDNADLNIYYALDDAGGNFIPVETNFLNNTPYQLTVAMNFASNAWSAAVGTTTIVSNKPITTSGASLNLGRIAAEWRIRNSSTPGDNFMVFDRYRITAQITPPNPPQLQVLGVTNGVAFMRLNAQSNYQFAVDMTTNLSNWSGLITNITAAGFFDFNDAAAANFYQRYYRARWVE